MSLWNTNVATKESWLRETNKKTEFPCKLTMDGSIFCKACEMLFRNWNKKSQIQHHVDSKSNKNLSLKEKRNHHKAMLEGVMGERQGKVSKLDVFGWELCEVFLSAFYVTQMSPNGDFDVTKSAFLMSPKYHQIPILMSPTDGLW